MHRGNSLKPVLHSLFLFISCLCMVLGFNTIDAMMWNFYNTSQWQLWHPNVWMLSLTFSYPVWDSYMMFGILPLMFGSVLFGFLLGLLHRKSKEEIWER